jgi:hypothetical protein
VLRVLGLYVLLYVLPLCCLWSVYACKPLNTPATLSQQLSCPIDSTHLGGPVVAPRHKALAALVEGAVGEGQDVGAQALQAVNTAQGRGQRSRGQASRGEQGGVSA